MGARLGRARATHSRASRRAQPGVDAAGVRNRTKSVRGSPLRDLRGVCGYGPRPPLRAADRICRAREAVYGCSLKTSRIWLIVTGLGLLTAAELGRELLIERKKFPK